MTTLKVEKAALLILQMAQRENFVELLRKLVDNSREEVKHYLAKRSPIVDSDNTIRLKGRLSEATISEDFKHPILLSAKQRWL